MQLHCFRTVRILFIIPPPEFYHIMPHQGILYIDTIYLIRLNFVYRYLEFITGSA